MAVAEVQIGPRSPDQFAPLVGPERMAGFLEAAQRLREHLSGRVVWNVNSTASGGGVAELLRSLVAYTLGTGVDGRWVVVQGTPEFFGITKRVHHALHGSPGDGSALDTHARSVYEEVLRQNVPEIASLIGPNDIVLLHDPQTAGMIPHIARTGARVVWRCHIGADQANEETEQGWEFLAPYLEAAHAFVFTREAYVPSVCEGDRAEVIPPTIDPLSPKNQEIAPETTRAILTHTGIIHGPGKPGPRRFLREDGSPGHVDRPAEVLRSGPAPGWETPLVVQVSRWDPLKDPLGVMQGFTRYVNGEVPGRPELVLAGPQVSSVSDDPEGEIVYRQVVEAWRALPDADRRRVHLVSLPMEDVEENAAIVNAIQRHAAVVVQKSLCEGFGLTVSEAMWKGRAVIASAVGGIQDQIDDEVNGLLLQDPGDLEAFGGILTRLLSDRALANTLGQAARERVRERFLVLQSLERWGDLIERLDRS